MKLEVSRFVLTLQTNSSGAFPISLGAAQNISDQILPNQSTIKRSRENLKLRRLQLPILFYWKQSSIKLKNMRNEKLDGSLKNK